jgi:hypothetical protein
MKNVYVAFTEYVAMLATRYVLYGGQLHELQSKLCRYGNVVLYCVETGAMVKVPHAANVRPVSVDLSVCPGGKVDYHITTMVA